ncbi:MAG TPA: hypothetical protein VLX92_05660 [Kofleriaceae bacterium]|nr:hypothetical protein [Kofleriaceae bacterium]
MTRPTAIAFALAACSLPSVDLTGKACPCPGGWVCNAATQTCARTAPGTDAPGRDATLADGASGADAAQAASCLPGAFGHELYSTATFADYPLGWTTGGGTWMPGASEVTQTDAMSDLAYIFRPLPQADYRIVATMHATSTGDGKAIEVAGRIDPGGAVHMYHCNWEPSDGAFLIQRTDAEEMGAVIQMTTIDLASLANYQPSDPVTIELQISGSVLQCCLHGIPGASISGSDTTYPAGDVGVKTYEMSGGFHDFAVYGP